MLAIKLQRVGKKHQPSYRVVVAEKRSKLGGPPVENLGSYNPFTKAAIIDKERVAYWLKTGAQPTVRVHNLFVKNGLISGPKIAVKIRKAKSKEEKPVEASVAPSAEKPPEQSKAVEVSAAPGEEKASGQSESAEEKKTTAPPAEKTEESTAPAESAPATEPKPEEKPVEGEEKVGG